MAIVNLTDSAKKQISDMLEEHNKKAVRLSLLGGGCAGFKYDWQLADDIDEGDEVIAVDNGKFVIDNMSIMYLIGSTIDYKKEIFGSYFDISNPASTSSCGCGESVGF